MHADTAASIAPGLFRLDRDGLTLLGGWSSRSGRAHFPLKARCPWSGYDDVEPIDLPRSGRLWSWTVVTSPPPGYTGDVPYGLGVVEMDVHGTTLRVVGRLCIASPDEVTVDRPMRTVAIEVPTAESSTVSWAFEPATSPELAS